MRIVIKQRTVTWLYSDTGKCKITLLREHFVNGRVVAKRSV